MATIKQIKKMSALLVIMCLIGLHLPGQQQKPVETGNLMGFIYGADGKTPVKDAQVVLTLQDPKTQQEKEIEYRSNVTDKNGDYKLMNMPVGDYQVSIWLKDKPYKIRRVDFFIKIMLDKTTFVSFSLRKKKFPVAIIIVGTAATAAAALIFGRVTEEEEQSPTRRDS